MKTKDFIKQLERSPGIIQKVNNIGDQSVGVFFYYDHISIYGDKLDNDKITLNFSKRGGTDDIYMRPSDFKQIHENPDDKNMIYIDLKNEDRWLIHLYGDAT